MPKDTQPASSEIRKTHKEDKSAPLHTCACGETHEHIPEGPGHRNACTSIKKFGNSCCCGSAKEELPPCGHGPKCT